MGTIYFFGGGFRGNGRAWSRPSCRPAMASSRRSTSEMRCSGLSCQPKTASAEHREGGGDSFFFFMRRDRDLQALRVHARELPHPHPSSSKESALREERTRGSVAHQERELPYHHPSSSTHHVWWGVFKNYVFLDPVNKSRGYVGNLQVQGRPRGSTSSPTKIKKKKKKKSFFWGVEKKKKKKKKKKK